MLSYLIAMNPMIAILLYFFNVLCLSMNVMSANNNDDGFRIVRQRKRGKSRYSKQISPFITGGAFEDRLVDKDTALRRLKSAKQDLEDSDYYKSFLLTLKESIEVLENKEVKEIFCLGLGHIGECTISRYQLALVLCLKEHFKVECHLHDPVFYSDECEILKGLDLNLIEQNEEGKHTLRGDGLTLVYFPHCPKQLTNNFLYHNWGIGLKNCVLICNSFMCLVENQTQEILNDNAPYILNIYSFTQEFSLVNSFRFNDIFNDTSIHIFPESCLNHITENFWNKKDNPVYEDGTEFITSKLIKKLHIS